MALLSAEEIKTLVDAATPPCVSLYMPTYRAGAEVQQNSIRFKNLIKQAEEKLSDLGVDRTEALALLEPAMALDREDFWQHQQEGFALFVGKDMVRHYCLPITFNELVVVNDRFHLKPLMSLLSGGGHFYLLALSQKHIRLFECDRHSINEVELPDVPQTLDEALNYNETAKAGQFRISTSKGGTSNPMPHAGSFHGQGSPDRDEHQVDILQFFHAIDEKLQPYLTNRRAPLVLTGVEYLFAIYREANTYPNLMEDGLAHHPDVLDVETIHRESWELVEPLFAKEQQEAIDHFHELNGTGKTSTDLNETVPAAFYGRIDRLFVPVGVQQWGSFDAENNYLEVHIDAEPGDEDLLNAAAVQTLLNGGTVYAVSPDEVPDEALVAAVFRY